MSAEPKLFISYRREESAAYAGRIYDAIVARFGRHNVFMDLDMAPGVDFVERITEAVARCHVLVEVMGPTWATVKDEEGKLRIADPQDYVRLELETALRRPEVTVIPVLIDGAQMPDRADLPPELRGITRRNALELSDLRWGYDVGRLISALEELLVGTTAVHVTPAGGDVVATTEAPSEVAAPTRVPRRADRARRWPRWRWIVALAGVAAIVAALLLILASDGGGPKVVDNIKIGAASTGVDVGQDKVWVTDTDGQTLTAVDPVSDERTKTPVRTPQGVTAAFGSVWVADEVDGTVWRIKWTNPGSYEVTNRIRVGARPGALQWGEHSVWVANFEADTVSRIDPKTRPPRVTDTIDVGDGPTGIAIGEGGVWVVNKGSKKVSLIDPLEDGGEVIKNIDVGAGASGVAAGEGSVWVTNENADSVSKIDPDARRVIDEIPVAGGPTGITVAEHWVWVTSSDEGTVSRIDPDTGGVVGEAVEVGGNPGGIAAGEGSIWVTTVSDGSVARIDP